MIPLIYRLGLSSAILLCLHQSFHGLAFTVPPIRSAHHNSLASGIFESSEPVEELSEERKANLFQFLLRDLEVEGVPLLAVDADQVFALQAALWTTMAEMSSQSSEQRACLIFESIPVPALRTFVDDFMVYKTQERLIKNLPELERFTLALVGKGIGPAIMIEADESQGAENYAVQMQVEENKYQAAMRMFVDRMVAEKQISGYPSSTGTLPESLAGATVAPMEYQICTFQETCHILSSFWNTICGLLSTPNQLRSSMLLLPGLPEYSRFGAISELISRSLCLYQIDDLFELLHFHPTYDRDFVYPLDKPAHGHLPPMAYLRAMLERNGNTAESQGLSEAELKLLNYHRRAPVAAVCIVPLELWSAGLSPEDAMVTLQVEGVAVPASGIASYSNNVLEVVQMGQQKLEEDLQAEARLLE